ncbi:hypothetical protein [Actomonas aquatica]|uniref:Uncharacterized protein n=1 Tax=Actomonas aquatica TaxID=2866162 RepID=A0ABZ1CC05_9BACT|nr:hypothetical protein [Opitutus sp. WL0086]WRQ89219.1 hypothetical protein K1X11_007350 [Opitutus sp. WL0086]
MSLDEMESTWHQQPPPPPSSAPHDWIEQTRRSFRWHALLVLFGALANGIGLILQLHRLLTDPGRTFSNSFWELLIPGLTFLICLVGAVLLRRALQRYHSLQHDTRRCLEHILHEKRQEITALTVWLPLTYLGFMGLVILGKFQSIAAEFESPANAWSGAWMAAVLFIVAGAFLFHRANAFLKPEVRELEATLHALDVDLAPRQ